MEINQDAVRWSAPERERAGRPLLVLMHGYLSHESDLFGLSPLMPLGPVIASLRAPITLETGFAWFPIPDNATVPEQFEAANESARAVLAWLDTVQSTSVGLLGFSQGGAMALQLLRHAPERFAYAVQLSGFALPGDLPGDETLTARKPPVFWGRGTLDEVIPVRAIEFTEAWLPQHSSLTANIYEDVAHAISEQELSDAGSFIRKHLD
ncbi:dienelactone hydrolase family protein [Parafrigoribacterium mesophilum]|uniref:alpha/beta hydrolase n=1 Tax=Parafrigoribacterium mesophilum TaxID=433646 RepID=UPI0031FC83DC